MTPPARGSGTKRGKPTTTRTLVLHHDDCLRHDPGLRHPERIDRAVAVLGALRDLGDCEFLPAPKATPEQLARVHGAEYPALLSEQEPAAGAGDRVALDPDTFLSPGSVDAALRGSGAACFAVDEVFAGRTHNAFCVTRPPGHHAEAATAMGHDRATRVLTARAT